MICKWCGRDRGKGWAVPFDGERSLQCHELKCPLNPVRAAKLDEIKKKQSDGVRRAWERKRSCS